MSEDALGAGIVAHGRSLFDRGLSPGLSGNLSVRTADGYLLTPTNTALGSLDAGRLSRLDEAGVHVDGDAPTKEAALHLALYSAHDDVNAIVHLHSTYAVAFSCLADVDTDDALPSLTPYYRMRVGRLPLVPYAPPGSTELVEAVRARAAESRSLLLANHGQIAAAGSLDAAVAAAEEIEETAKLALLLRGLPARELGDAFHP